jgi:hypothetical protein
MKLWRNWLKTSNLVKFATTAIDASVATWFDTLLLGEVVSLEGPPVAMLKTLGLRAKVPDLSWQRVSILSLG